jgi:DeoR/GlpR family transcriptional regulator of sugar metabolism
VHGGAVLAQRGAEEPGFDKKVLCQQQEKAAIASAAATMVKPGSSIGLSAGTTTCMLALQLAQVGDGRSHVILTGGDFRTPSDALVDPTADATIRSSEGHQLLASQVDDLRVAGIRSLACDDELPDGSLDFLACFRCQA